MFSQGWIVWKVELKFLERRMQEKGAFAEMGNVICFSFTPLISSAIQK